MNAEQLADRLRDDAEDAVSVTAEPNGHTRVELELEGLDSSRLFDFFTIVGRHYVHLNHVSLMGSVCPIAVEASRNGPGDAVRFGVFFPDRSRSLQARLRVEKQNEFDEADVEALVDLRQRLGESAGPVAAHASFDAAARLSMLGATLFRGDADWSQQRIAGYASLQQEIETTILLPLLNPDVFRNISSLTRLRPVDNVPRAVLFEGPPGTGKTTMARVIGARAAIPLVYVPVESVMSSWFGKSENRLAEVFRTCRELGRCIVFLDEIDAFAGSRDRDLHEVTRRVLSVLLREIQGITSRSDFLLIGATNRAQDLDHALLSRFNRTLHFPLPSAQDRVAIFHAYAKHLRPDEASILANLAEGLAPRDIEDACGDAERTWARELIASGAPISAPGLRAYEAALQSRRRHA